MTNRLRDIRVIPRVLLHVSEGYSYTDALQAVRIDLQRMVTQEGLRLRLIFKLRDDEIRPSLDGTYNWREYRALIELANEVVLQDENAQKELVIKSRGLETGIVRGMTSCTYGSVKISEAQLEAL